MLHTTLVQEQRQFAQPVTSCPAGGRAFEVMQPLWVAVLLLSPEQAQSMRTVAHTAWSFAGKLPDTIWKYSGADARNSFNLRLPTLATVKSFGNQWKAKQVPSRWSVLMPLGSTLLVARRSVG